MEWNNFDYADVFSQIVKKDVALFHAYFGPWQIRLGPNDRQAGAASDWQLAAVFEANMTTTARGCDVQPSELTREDGLRMAERCQEVQ